MSESIQSTLISALPAATKVSDTDIVVLENGSTTQKITIAQLKEALGINALNTNLMATGQGTFKDRWVPGFMVYGMGFVIIIPKHYRAHKLNITSAKVFINSWHNATLSSCSELLNHWSVILNVDANSSMENGKTYLVSINGTIS